MAKREYTFDDVNQAVGLYNRYLYSIREVSKILKIPKSIIARWLKDPETWRTKYFIAEKEKISEHGYTRKEVRDFLEQGKKIKYITRNPITHEPEGNS